jgi:hypothetical protein
LKLISFPYSESDQVSVGLWVIMEEARVRLRLA